MTAKPKKRHTYLDRVQKCALDDWSRALRRALFTGDGCMGPFLVGSAAERADWRDVDVREILRDETYDALAAIVDVDRLGIVVSRWGQDVTDLPVDFQVQRMTDANEMHPAAGKRHALGIGEKWTSQGDGVAP